MRIVLFTGKGGVGKTTVACATAIQIATAGRKTLVMSTDPAHSLADALGLEVGPDAVEVAPNLWAEQIDPQRRLEESWREIQQHAVSVLNWAGLAEIEAEELAVLPGLDEVFSLADVKGYHDKGPYEVLVVDCAPTGETLRLLSLPDVIQWYMQRIFPIERRVVGALRPFARRITDFPLPDSGVYEAVLRFYRRLEGVRDVLTDPRTTSVRLVLNPERMVIAEAKRTFTYLSLFGYRVDAVVVNRLLPDDVSDPYFNRWKQIQAEYLNDIRTAFGSLPLLSVPLHDEEPIGAELLAGVGELLYGRLDAASVLHTDNPMSVVRRGEDYVLTINLPFARRDELEMNRRDGELFIRVGPYRRTIMLPRTLSSREVATATLEGQRVEVVFERGSHHDGRIQGGEVQRSVRHRSRA